MTDPTPESPAVRLRATVGREEGLRILEEIRLKEQSEIEHLVAERLASIKAENARLREALGWFLGDPRFVVTVGGNPIAIEAMLTAARAALGDEP